jgi:hypothetical protein
MTPIHITTYTGFTDFDRARMAQVLAAANRVLSDPRFKERIQSISHFDSTTDSGFAVWARMDAADLGISATLYTLPWYKRFSKEDAKDLPDGVAIVRGYFEAAEIPKLVATLNPRDYARSGLRASSLHVHARGGALSGGARGGSRVPGADGGRRGGLAGGAGVRLQAVVASRKTPFKLSSCSKLTEKSGSLSWGMSKSSTAWGFPKRARTRRRWFG